MKTKTPERLNGKDIKAFVETIPGEISKLDQLTERLAFASQSFSDGTLGKRLITDAVMRINEATEQLNKVHNLSQVFGIEGEEEDESDNTKQRPNS